MAAHAKEREGKSEVFVLCQQEQSFVHKGDPSLQTRDALVYTKEYVIKKHHIINSLPSLQGIMSDRVKGGVMREEASSLHPSMMSY